MPPRTTRFLLIVIPMIILGLRIDSRASPDGSTVALESSDGKILEVILLEKSDDRVKVKIQSKFYTIPFSKLSEASIATVRAARIPVLSDFRIAVDISRNSKKSTSTSTSRGTTTGAGGRPTSTTYQHHSSHRTNRIAGTVTISNRDTKHISPNAEVHVSVLTSGKSGISAITQDRYTLGPIKSLGETTFNLSESVVTNTVRGDPALSGGPQRRYYGYIAAIVIEGKIVAIKSSHESYEDNVEEASRFLGIRKSR